MSLIFKEDMKLELGKKDTADDALLTVLADAISDMLEQTTGKKWGTADGEGLEVTEYYNADARCDRILLNSYPVDSTKTVEVWDDPDWVWDASHKLASTDFRVDYVRGIVYYNGFFYEGKQNVKVKYTIGDASGAGAGSLTPFVKQMLVRQACHWYKQATNKAWDESSRALPSGGGTVSYKSLESNILPEFALFMELNSR